jgi:plasmid stability protein
MPTLYVENVPEDLYEAIRARARARRSSIAAEVLAILSENMPTPKELARRQSLVLSARKLRLRRSPSPGPFPSTEEMLREDRAR